MMIDYSIATPESDDVDTQRVCFRMNARFNETWLFLSVAGWLDAGCGME